MYKPLVVATFAVPDLTAGHVAFLKSFSDKVGDRADLVLATEAARAVRDALKGIGAVLHRSTLPDTPYLRAADAISRIARDQPDRPVLAVHARYTVFQSADLFGGYRPETVSVAAEGPVVAHDIVHRERWDEAAKWGVALPETDLAEVPVVSRTVAAGPARLVAAYQTTLAALLLTKDGATADVVMPSALALMAVNSSWHRVVPVETPWVAHGRSAHAAGIAFAKAVAVTRRSGEPYAILTDWDRVPGNEGVALWRKYS